MTNVVYELNNEKSWQSALLQPGELLLLNSRYADAESFMQAYNATGFKKLMTSKKTIVLADITRLSHTVLSAKKLLIKYGSKTTTLQFTTPGQPEALAKEIAAVKGWYGHTATISKWRTIAPLLPGLLITPVAGWLMHSFATGDLDGSSGSKGRNKAVGMLLEKLAKFLGPELVVVIAGAVMCLFVYLLIRRLNERQEELVYE